MQTQFIAAINQICDEKNIPRDIVIETVEHALAAAYKKDYGHRDQEVRVELSEETGEIKVYVSKEVVETKEEVENNFLQIDLAEAKKINKKAKVGEVVEIEDRPKDFGRIAAQTAKQVIIQRIREAERDIVFTEYKDKEGELMNAVVQRIEGGTVILDLGRASGVLFSNEQVSGERYYIGQRIKVYLVKVEQTSRGPQVVVSRSHPGVVRRLFELEVPEIESGIVEVKSIAREAGHRTKLAVSSNEENVDPVGSCVGQRGIRVQAVMAELGEEKIDIILWDEDPKAYITNALSPAKVVEIELNEKDKKATVKVPEDQLSLAIGKQGQNVRLAAKLTGWNVDIASVDGSGIEAAEGAVKAKEEKTDLEAEILKAVEEKAAPKSEDEGDTVIKEEPKAEAKQSEEPAEEKEVQAEADQPEAEKTEEKVEGDAAEKDSAEEISDILEAEAESKSEAVPEPEAEKGDDAEKKIEDAKETEKSSEESAEEELAEDITDAIADGEESKDSK